MESDRNIIFDHLHLDHSEFDEQKLLEAFINSYNTFAKVPSERIEILNVMKPTVEIVHKIYLSNDERLLRCFIAGLKLLFNMSVPTTAYRLELWESIKLSWFDWIRNDNIKIKNYVCGIVYNILLVLPDISIVIMENKAYLDNIFSAAQNSSEFAVLILEYFWLRNGGISAYRFMNNVALCNLDLRVSIFNLLYEFARKNSINPIYADWIVNKYRDIVAMKVELKEFDELEEIYIFIKILIEIVIHSVSGEYYDMEDTLNTSLFLLEAIHYDGKNADSIFAPTDNMFPERTSVENLKSNLIRLIGNLSWKRKDIQDALRNTDKIPLILDCCIRDGKNPFITESVIFAIRNLCEGNLQNQSYIKQLSVETLQAMSAMSPNWQKVFGPIDGR